MVWIRRSSISLNSLLHLFLQVFIVVCAHSYDHVRRAVPPADPAAFSSAFPDLVPYSKTPRAAVEMHILKQHYFCVLNRTMSMNSTSSQLPDKTTLLFLRRMRKAGSTSLSDYLLNVKRVYDSDIPCSVADIMPKLRLDEVEYNAINTNCFLGHGSVSMRSTFFITHLRNPISRINSEFWFSGPGSKHHSINESHWRAWIQESKPGPDGTILKFRGMLRSKFYASTYHDNYYVRLLSNDCGECTKRFDGTAGNGNSVDGCSVSESKHLHESPIQPSKLIIAKQLLDSFYLVLITEWFKEPALKALLVRKLEVALNIAPQSLLARRLESMLPLNVKRITVNKHSSGGDVENRQAPPLAIRRFLESDNALDMDLYDYAQKISLHDLQPYRSEERKCRLKHPG